MENEFIFTAEFIPAYVLIALIAYILGSISFAVIFSRVFTNRDVRNYGSGNAGATNVFRAIGILPGILTFICDIAKGAAAILCSRWIYRLLVREKGLPESAAALSIAMCVAGIFALLGHLYPLYFGFKGGKGVLTVGGIILMLSPVRFLFVLLAFIVVFAITQRVSMGSCAAAIAYPITTFIHCMFFEHRADPSAYPMAYVWIMTAMAVLLGAGVLIKHKDNIRRMIAGTEPKMVFKSKKGESEQEKKYS